MRKITGTTKIITYKPKDKSIWVGDRIANIFYLVNYKDEEIYIPKRIPRKSKVTAKFENKLLKEIYYEVYFRLLAENRWELATQSGRFSSLNYKKSITNLYDMYKLKSLNLMHTNQYAIKPTPGLSVQPSNNKILSFSDYKRTKSHRDWYKRVICRRRLSDI